MENTEDLAGIPRILTIYQRINVIKQLQLVSAPYCLQQPLKSFNIHYSKRLESSATTNSIKEERLKRKTSNMELTDLEFLRDFLRQMQVSLRCCLAPKVIGNLKSLHRNCLMDFFYNFLLSFKSF